MENRKKRWGDRRDARWVREIDGLHSIFPHLMNKRTDAEVFMQMTFDITDTLAYIARKNEGETEYRATLFHCIMMAIAKTVYMRPLLNRFISGRRFYDRYDITMGFITAALEQGLHIPDDIDLFGFDSVETGSLMNPPLPVVRQPEEEIGRIAAQFMIDRLSGFSGDSRHTRLKCKVLG